MRLAWGGRLGGGPARGMPAGGGPGREIGEGPGKGAAGAGEGADAGKGGFTKGGGLDPGKGPEGRLICRFCMLSANELAKFGLLRLTFGGV